jgi:hypothetical protein
MRRSTARKKPVVARGLVTLNPSDAPPTPPEDDPLAEFYDQAYTMDSEDDLVRALPDSLMFAHRRINQDTGDGVRAIAVISSGHTYQN